MDRFKELGIDTHGRTSGKMKTKCPWCHAQRTDKRDKSLSVNLRYQTVFCATTAAHTVRQPYMPEKAESWVIRWSNFQRQQVATPVVRPLKSRTATQSKGHSHRSKLNGVVTSATFRRKYWWKLAWLSPPSRCLYPERRKAGKRGLSLLQLFRKRGIGEHEVPRLTKALQITARSAHHPLQHRRHPRHAGVHPRGRGI